MLNRRRAGVVHAGVLLIAIVLSFGCRRTESHLPPEPIGDEPSLQNYLDGVRQAKLGDFKGGAAKVIDVRSFEEMKAHLLDVYLNVHETNSFKGRDGAWVDCIPLEQQRSLRSSGVGTATVLSSIPKPAVGPTSKPRPADHKPADLTLLPGSKDVLGNLATCPRGSIPLRRISLASMTRFKTLHEYLQRGHKMAGFKSAASSDSDCTQLDSAGTPHCYAVGEQSVKNLGGDSWLNVWSPTVDPAQMSLSQQWFTAGSGSSLQTVEAGWQVYDGANENKAALFIFYTTSNYTDGCYNLTCSGFVQVADNVYLGATFDAYSVQGGEQREFELQWQRATDGNWWLFYRGSGDYIAVGYYPKSLFGTGGMATAADDSSFGGEDTGKLAAQMGGGHFAKDGYGHAAFQDDIFYIDGNGTSQWSKLAADQPEAKCYTIDIAAADGGRGTHFLFGGPQCPPTGCSSTSPTGLAPVAGIAMLFFARRRPKRRALAN